MWLRRHCDSFTPKKAEQVCRQVLMASLNRDDGGCYLDLRDIDKKLLQAVALELAHGSWEQNYQESFLRIANEIARYAGLSAIERLAEIVDPKSTNIKGKYDDARSQLAERLRERETARLQAPKTKPQNRYPRR